MSSRSKRIVALAKQISDDNLSDSQLDTVVQLEALPSTSRDSIVTSDIAPSVCPAQQQSSSLQDSSAAKIDVPSTSFQSKTYVFSSSEESEPYSDSGDSYVPSEIESDSRSEDSEEENTLQMPENNEVQERENNDEQEEENNEEQAEGNQRIKERSKIGDTWKDCEDIPSNIHFSGTSGLQNLTCDLTSPYDIYRQFVTDEVLDIIVKETNRYASQYISTHVIRRRSMLRKWKETNRSEMKKFIGILLIMGMNSLPKMRLYWSGDQMFGNRVIQKTMKRDRFDCLLKFFHLCNNEDPSANDDRLFKIRRVMNLICNQFKRTVLPGEDLVIDESMVPWRGRLTFRQYLPAKSHKYGVKLYKICSPDGYTYDIRVYAGKNNPDMVENDHGHTHNVCMDLLEGYLNEGRILYADNFYTSVELAESLLEKNTYTCGTLRSNRRGNPKSVTKKKLKKGEVYGQQNEKGVRIMKWVDKRDVLMISTVPGHTDTLQNTGKKNRKGEDVLKPPSVICYNKAKKGVDVSDQMSSYYSCIRKSVKWYKKVIFEVLLGTAVVNTWVVFNNFGDNPNKLDILQLRQRIAAELIKEVNTDNEEEPEPRREQHNIENNPATLKRSRSKASLSHHNLDKYEGPVRKTRKRCLSCYKKHQQLTNATEARSKSKKVATYCRDCPGQPTLCLPCYNEIHQ